MSDNINIQSQSTDPPAEPLTREEQYLSAIAGVTPSSDIPEKPLTRIERYLNKIVENGGGGSGFEPTDEQLAAMNSGITAEDVEQIDTNKNNILTLDGINSTFAYNATISNISFYPRKNVFEQNGEIKIINSPTRSYCYFTATTAFRVSPKYNVLIGVLNATPPQALTSYTYNALIYPAGTYYIAFRYTSQAEFSASTQLSDICTITGINDYMSPSINPTGYELIQNATIIEIYSDVSTSQAGSSMQGACTDEAYIYYCHDNPKEIYKYDIANGTAISASIDVGHGNSMTYNYKTDKLYVVGVDGNLYVVDKSTLAITNTIDISSIVTSAVSIAYNRYIDKYFIVGGGYYTESKNPSGIYSFKKMYVLDDEFELEKTYTLPNFTYAQQGMETDSRYIYLLYTKVLTGANRRNYIEIFDLNCRYIGEYVFDTTEEIEEICKYGDNQFYLSINKNKGGTINTFAISAYTPISYFDVHTKYQLNG
ncbi:MAG: hypothetical protein J6Y64_06905 [Ruminococcus sp.]|nr:hypothetical protein [Ruminococcus sp.]